jgi:hypothetical protein
VTALLFKNALDTPFLFDDRDLVLLNTSLVNPWDVWGVLTWNVARPVLNLSFAVDRIVWGLSSFGYHATNGGLHILAVGLFYGWCTRALTDESSRARHLGTLWPEWPAFFATCVFAFHPVMASTVVYVSARSEILCAIALLLTLTFARRAIVASNRVSAALALACGALALGSSSSAAGVPLIVLAYDAWVLRDGGWIRRWWRVYLPSLVVVLVAGMWMASALLVQDRVPPHGLFSHVLGEATVAWRYIGLLLLPRGQSLVHEVAWPAATSFRGLSALLLLAGCVAVAVSVRRSYPLVAFGLVWFVLALVPTSLIPVRDAMVEKRVYVAAAGLLLAAGSTLAEPLARRRSARAGATVAVVALLVMTYKRNEHYASAMDVWAEAVQRAPNAWQAHLGYGDLLREIQRCDSAKAEYAQVLRLYPGQPDATVGFAACK